MSTPIVPKSMTDNRIRSNSALRNSLTQKHPSSPNRKALSRDTWNQTDVWVLSSSSDQWKAGTCVSHAAVEDASTAAAVTAWRFTVELAKGVRVEIEAHSIDDSCSEFDAVKRRDDAMAGLNVADMTCLSYLNEPEMLECLRRRYAAKQIYTNTGPILLAINPFQSLPLYSEEVLLASINADLTDAAKLGPHVYQVAKRAYTQMLVDKFNPDVRENQSILVSGESGAG